MSETLPQYVLDLHAAEKAPISEELSELMREASSSQTYPARLGDIYRLSKDRRVRRLLANNPNTPLQILWALAINHPREFVHNPVLPLLLLENPGLGAKVPWTAVLPLLTIEELPEWLLKGIIGQNRNVASEQEAIVNHVAYVGEVKADGHHLAGTATFINSTPAIKMAATYQQSSLTSLLQAFLMKLVPDSLLAPQFRNWATMEKPEWRNAMVANRHLDLPFMEYLWRAGASPDLKGFQEPQPMTAVELELLAEHGPYAKCLVMAHPNTPPKLRASLIKQNWSLIRLAITHPHATSEMLSLALDKLPEEQNSGNASQLLGGRTNERIAIARHANTPPQALARLAKDTHKAVRAFAARHPKMPLEQLEKLALDADSRVRGGVARNVKASPEILEILAGDEHSKVRFDVARHPKTPRAALEMLANESDADILMALLRRKYLPDELRELASENLQRIQQETAPPSAPPDIEEDEAKLRLWSNDSDVGLRYEAAGHRAVPLDVLEKLSQDDSSWVRRRVSQNSRTPEWIVASMFGANVYLPELGINPRATSEELSKLLDEVAQCVYEESESSFGAVNHKHNERMAILTMVGKHANCTREVRRQLSAIKEMLVFYSLATMDVEFSRFAALSNPRTSPEVLQLNLHDKERLYRHALTQNPALPLVMLRYLTHDGHRMVRFAALEALAQREK